MPFKIKGGETLLSKIKELCAEHKTSISKVEEACGIGSNSMHKWDAHTPSVDKVKRVADYFGCTVDELLKED